MDDKFIWIGKTPYIAAYFKSVSEKKAISDYAHLDRSKVINIWKQANGLKAKSKKPVTKKVAKPVEEIAPTPQPEAED